MADTIHLEIVTPDGLTLAADVNEVTAPSVDGEFGVLPGHVPLLAALPTGIVTYQLGGEKHAVAVGRGFAEVSADKALLLTDRFIKKEDIDPVRRPSRAEGSGRSARQVRRATCKAPSTPSCSRASCGPPPSSSCTAIRRRRA